MTACQQTPGEFIGLAERDQIPMKPLAAATDHPSDPWTRVQGLSVFVAEGKVVSGYGIGSQGHLYVKLLTRNLVREEAKHHGKQLESEANLERANERPYQNPKSSRPSIPIQLIHRPVTWSA